MWRKNLDRISTVEDLMIGALKAALPDVRTIETRVTPLSEPELMKLIGAAPFVLIENNGGDPVQPLVESGKTRIWKLVFNLFVAAKSLRSKQDAQRGSYEMLETIRQTLDGSTLIDTEDAAKRAGIFKWEGQTIFFDLPGGTIYQAVYSLKEAL
jgi:hypothetical protein